MFKELLKMILEQLNKDLNKDSGINNKILQIAEEINELEIKHAKALADVERWGDISDNSDWRTVEYNRIGRVIEAKKRLIQTLKQNS